MPRLNRGETTKATIRLTQEAHDRIEKYAKNLNLSKAGVVLFVMSNVLKALPTKSKMEELQATYSLARQHFTLTVTRAFSNEMDDIAEDYNMKKSVFMGLLVSDYFETKADPELLRDDLDTEPTWFRAEINEDVKKKIMNYSEEHYIPLSGLLTYCILNGPNEELPFHPNAEKGRFHTTIPAYARNIVKNNAIRMQITEDFYAEICIYKAFSCEGQIFNR